MPMSDKPRWEIIHGDSLTVLENFPPSTFDAVITDPPYDVVTFSSRKEQEGRRRAANIYVNTFFIFSERYFKVKHKCPGRRIRTHIHSIFENISINIHIRIISRIFRPDKKILSGNSE